MGSGPPVPPAASTHVPDTKWRGPLFQPHQIALSLKAYSATIVQMRKNPSVNFESNATTPSAKKTCVHVYFFAGIMRNNSWNNCVLEHLKTVTLTSYHQYNTRAFPQHDQKIVDLVVKHQIKHKPIIEHLVSLGSNVP